MAAVNSVARRGLPLPAFSPRAVLMYSAAVGGEGAVALQVREAAPGELAAHDHDLLADLLHAAADITAGGDADGLSALLGAASPELALASDASDSLPLPDHDGETVSSSGSVTSSGGGAGEARAPLAAKKVRPKPASPNRQGPQQCQVCNKIFGNASALAKHKLTHSDERKYVCGMCAKAFKRQDHLNGHMLTHRNKKPYECKADGCGKSYCDARSLRRHTENHHQPPHDSASSSSSSSGSAERDGAGGGAGASPASPVPAAAPQHHHHSDSSSSGSEKSSGSGGSESGSSPPATPPAPGTPPAPAPAPARSAKPPPQKPHHSKPKTFSVTLQQSSAGGAAGGAAGAGACRSHDVKPVECNLCHRKFKNIPALNGHMRLHGGYFKKDSDSKKLDKKEASGPPLQTASVSVRALIEEKIISRRATAASTPSTGTSTDTMTTRIGFVAPAPPPLTSRATAGPASPAPASPAQFVSPRAPPPHTQSAATTSAPVVSVANVSIGAVTPKDSTLIELLKKGNTKAVKRSASDPGQSPPQPELTFRPELFGVSFQPDDGYFSPALQDDAFQFGTSDQLDELGSLEDYASVAAALRARSPVAFPSSRRGRLAAVLNSPLPESLADFGACHGGSEPGSPGPPLYAGSPGLAYPTPPASHDAHSPAHTAPRASSPLSAAFFTATMSSQEEVEEALEEVLPEECGSLDAFALEPAPAPRRIMLNSEDPLLSSSPRDFVHGRAPPRRAPRPAPPPAPSHHHWHDPPQQTASLQVCVEGRESVPAVFPSPSSVPASPQRRKRRGSPVPPHRSRLRRAPTTAHYTPRPMLPPDRDGPGLFVQLTAGLPGESEASVSEELVPPQINVGPDHQAEIPELCEDRADLHRAPEQMLWDPGINDTLDDNEVRMFMELATCAAMPVGGHSREYALQTLGECGGDVRAATLRLMARPAPAPPEPRWAPDEVEAFLAGLSHYDKDFYRIAQLIRTKDSKQCVQFYYFWKKVTKDYKTLFLRSWNMEIPIANQGVVGGGFVVHGQSCASSPAPYDGEEYPCKICGKIFNKVKSRSAHMKSHRPLDAEPRRPKIEKPYEKVERFNDRSQSQATADYQSKPPAPAL